LQFFAFVLAALTVMPALKEQNTSVSARRVHSSFLTFFITKHLFLNHGSCREFGSFIILVPVTSVNREGLPGPENSLPRQPGCARRQSACGGLHPLAIGLRACREGWSIAAKERGQGKNTPSLTSDLFSYHSVFPF
jgi:hypothetical protein